jgi:hypothetical protein
VEIDCTARKNSSRMFHCLCIAVRPTNRTNILAQQSPFSSTGRQPSHSTASIGRMRRNPGTPG